MNFRLKHRITVTDKIFITLLLASFVIGTILNEPKIIALLIVVSTVSVNIRDYMRKKKRKHYKDKL
jgi:uncharacterized membrane protein